MSTEQTMNDEPHIDDSPAFREMCARLRDQAPPLPMPVPNTLYKRRGDMSPVGTLSLIMQEDGDVIVMVRGSGPLSDRPIVSASVEFCQPGGGGGKSSHTLRALKALALAIQKDNDERPISER